MIHKKARKQFSENKQTKDMDYWNHVLCSYETKINLFGSDGVKRVWRQPGEEYKDKCVLPTVKHAGGGVMVWGCMSAAGTGEIQFIKRIMYANMNEWCIYIALCVLLFTQSALQSWGGVSPQPPPLCSMLLDDAMAATGQRHQCAHHTPATGGEERES